MIIGEPVNHGNVNEILNYFRGVSTMLNFNVSSCKVEIV